MAEVAAASPQPARPASEEAVHREPGIQPLEGAGGQQPEFSGLWRAGFHAPCTSTARRLSIRERRRHALRRQHGELTTRRFGDNLSLGNSRLCRSPDYQPDHELSYIDNFSSSDKENVNPGRKRMLDDALFEFFRKEAVKSLKMDFSNFCNDSDIWNKLKSKEVLTDKEIFVCFMVVAFKCFLFPTMDEFPNTDFLGILQDPTSASGVDLCLLVYEHLISGVSKFSRTCKLNARKPKHFEFCYYAISVYYLDSLDFGARKLDQSVPRISVCKGNLIKLFFDLDHKKNLFGKRQLKKNLPHCYREFGAIGDSKSDNDASNHFSAEFKNSLHIKFGSRLDPKIIDGIIDSVWSAQHEKLPFVLKCELLVNNVLNFLIDLKSCEVKMQPEDSNIDIASNLDLISPNVFSKAIPTSISTSEFVRSPGSPELLSSKAGGINIVKTDSRSLVFMASPISRINFSSFSNAKVTNALSDSKGCLLEDNQIGRNMNFTGSKQAPIPISDFSPKPQINQSPELEITGTSSFSFRQGELAKKGDEMYNSMSNNVAQQGLEQCVPKQDDVKTIENFIDLSQNAFEERLPKDDLVILQPKNSLVLPLVQNGRFPVSDLDIKHYCAIVDLAYTKGIQKTYAVKFSKVHCSYISLGQSLMVAGHVDNFLLPVFCRKLFEDNHPSKSGRHHFFSLVGESILDYENDVQYSFVSKAFLGAATASKGKRLELSDRIKNFIKLWMLIFKTDENIFKNFGVMYANVPKQDNADDCGIFTMKLMEIFKLELNMRRYFSKEDIVNIRIQYANKLFFCKRNNADKSIVVDYHLQG
uniref:Uncharacterized protein n=1 Tax=Avena sativa TaxID=4498 RepID=A0ACD5WDP0_AVESA